MAGNSGPMRFASTRSSTEILTGSQRYEKPIYDFYLKDAPCREACPAGHDIAWALFMVGKERYDLAFSTFKEESPFPSVTGRVCYHPCESECNRGRYDQPLAISALERVFSDLGDNGEVEKPDTKYSERVAIIGSGPSGLTCAYHLRRLGYPITVFEADAEPGGALLTGIPDYRLSNDIIRGEIDKLSRMGIRFEVKTKVGEDVSFEQIRKGHKAVFLGVGLPKGRMLDTPGADGVDVMTGVDFLFKVNIEGGVKMGKRVMVIGAGDVAIDVSRSAIRSGAEEVTICCVEKLEDIPAHPEEVKAAISEGVKIESSLASTLISPNGGGLDVNFAGVRSFGRQSDGVVKIEIDEHTKRTISTDQIICAIAQQSDLGFLPEGLNNKAQIKVDIFGRTNEEGVFSGGDVTGTYNVVNAIGSGKRAAIGIDCYLRGRDVGGLMEKLRIGGQGALSMKSYMEIIKGKDPQVRSQKIIPIEEINLDYFPEEEKTHHKELSLGERKQSFREVNFAFTPEEALREALRCFNCGMCNMCGNCYTFCPDSAVIQKDDWSFEIATDYCKGCGVCVQECPRSAMSMVIEEEL